MTPHGSNGHPAIVQLLARQVLRIAREHDRLWSSLIKLQGNGGSDVTCHDVSVKASDIQPKRLLRGIDVVKNIASAPDSSVDDRDRGSRIA